ncbi:hypothetical protein GGI42DRAFT_141922 [Trichoderma sp. SZMC 28013]
MAASNALLCCASECFALYHSVLLCATLYHPGLGSCNTLPYSRCRFSSFASATSRASISKHEPQTDKLEPLAQASRNLFHFRHPVRDRDALVPSGLWAVIRIRSPACLWRAALLITDNASSQPFVSRELIRHSLVDWPLRV